MRDCVEVSQAAGLGYSLLLPGLIDHLIPQININAHV